MVATCQQLVRVTLMPRVKHNLIAWAVKDGVDSDEDFNRAKP
jgi:hypothetical protein